MDFNTWKNEKSYTVGAELEVRFHNPEDFSLLEISSKILPSIPKDIINNVHQEFLECMLELVSPVCKNSTQILEHIKNYIEILNEIGKKNNFLLATSGSHSFKIDSLKAINVPRYKEITQEYGLLMKKFHICGFHIHVGLSSSKIALHTYNYMLEKLPLFLALSANSPYFDGEDTSLLSYRTQLFAQLPRAGMPEYFDSFEDMSEMYESLKKSSIVNSASDLWWDLRISPKHKTLEIRICDASNDYERLEDLINFYQALCLYANLQKVDKLPNQILKQNKWNALRHGFNGTFQNKKVCTTVKEYFLDLLLDMEKENIFEKLSISPLHVERLKNRAFEKSLAHKQKETYKKTNSLIEVEKLGVLG